MSGTPEAMARKNIDRQLEACGWTVQDRQSADIAAPLGVAIREFPLQGGDVADYLLYADSKAIGVVDAGSLPAPCRAHHHYQQELPTQEPSPLEHSPRG